MSKKAIITIALLLFVVASVVTLVAKEAARGTETSGTTGAEASQASAHVQSKNLEAPVITVYYFHGTARCPTCIKMEKYSQEAVEQGFVKDIEAGTITFKSVNVEDAGNEHFVKDYELFTKAVIVTETVDGQQTRWVNLNKIWDLASDRTQFITYVQTEIKSFLGRV